MQFLLALYLFYSKIWRHHNYFLYTKPNNFIVKTQTPPLAHYLKQKNTTYNNDAALIPKPHQTNRTLIWKNKNPHFL